MRSIKRIFEKIKRQHPVWSDWVCFSLAISGKGFSKKAISSNFNKLVEKSDYSKEEKKEILEWLFHLSMDRKQG